MRYNRKVNSLSFSKALANTVFSKGSSAPVNDKYPYVVRKVWVFSIEEKRNAYVLENPLYIPEEDGRLTLSINGIHYTHDVDFIYDTSISSVVLNSDIVLPKGARLDIRAHRIKIPNN